MKKKWISLFVCILALSVLFVFTACGGDGSGASTPAAAGSTGSEPAAGTGEPIKIGYIGPLTGEGAPWGDAEVNGLKIAVDEINGKGGILGRPVEVIYYDNRGDNVETTNAAKKLIEQDKVCCIIGTNASGSSIALSLVCEQYEIPHISTTATNPKVTVTEEGTVMPFTFRATLIDPQQGSIAANFATEKLDAMKAAVVYDISSDYGNGLTEYFIQQYEQNGGEIVANEAYKAGDVDFRAQLTKVKEAAPEIIFLPATYKEIALIANQSRELGIDATFVGGDGWISKELFKLATDSVDGSYFVYSFNINSDTLADFKAEYLERYDKIAGEVSGGCFFSYDCMYVLDQAITAAGSTDPIAIRDALEKADYEGLTGTIKIDPATHNPSKEGAVFKIVGMEYENAE